MKIGIYGGTFNPPHLGHITAARAVFELLKLDRLLMVPDGQPPHKDLPPGSPPPEQRLALTRLAADETGLGDRVEVLDMELRQPGKSYTAATLTRLRALYPEDELWLLMGADMFLTLHRWREPETVLSLAGIAAFGRTITVVSHVYANSFLKRRRVPHVLGTEQEAIRLAERYGADVEKARRAALLHDCTKKLDMAEQLALCRQYGIALDDLERKALKLLHARTGAAIAREVFGVDDEIYSAIRWHTTGHANMTLLEKIIYLADYIEPSRDFPGVEALRRVCYEDLDRGLLTGLEMTIEEMRGMGNPVHHATLEARDFLKG